MNYLQNKLACPYCEQLMHTICKPAGYGSHMRGCAKKHNQRYSFLDFCKYNFENVNEDFFRQKLNEEYSVLEIDQTYFGGYGVTRKCCKILGIPLRTIKEATNLNRCRNKYKETCLIKYGYENALCDGSVIKEKRNSTMIEKYGVINFFAINDFQEYLKDKLGSEEYHKRKSDRSSQVWLGKSEGEKQAWLAASLQVHFRDPRTGKYRSKQEMELEESLTRHNLKVSPQYKIGKYFYDLFIENTNILIEYNGDFWHANPQLYSAEKYMYAGLTAEDIWTKNKLKYEHAQKNGYDVIIIWEQDYHNNNDSFESIVEKTVCEKLNKY